MITIVVMNGVVIGYMVHGLFVLLSMFDSRPIDSKKVILLVKSIVHYRS